MSDVQAVEATGECYACAVGVATGPESHSRGCGARHIPMPEQTGQWPVGGEWDWYRHRVAKAKDAAWDRFVKTSEDVTCTCAPCVSPAYGAPGYAHCAACCYGSLIEEFNPSCPVAEHAEMGRRQFPDVAAVPAVEGFDDEPPF